ncbi:MAG: hypothetical protein EA380_11580 [Phycisphaeraceae bacterium]|nr:MAG: hypothetical protein EA380_11580 [Phycisphaeraceae bacterium]
MRPTLAAVLLLATILITSLTHADPQAPPAPPVPDPLADLAFLVGTWQGDMRGDFVEEIWSAPRAGAMMGMFRWVAPDATTRMYEILTITHEDDQTILRLRHFSSSLVAWEEKDAPIQLHLAESAPNSARFVNRAEEQRLESISFSSSAWGRLTIAVDFRPESGRPNLRFDLKHPERIEHKRERDPFSNHFETLDIETTAATPWQRSTNLDFGTLIFNKSFEYQIFAGASHVNINKPHKGVTGTFEGGALTIAPVRDNTHTERRLGYEIAPRPFPGITIGSLWLVNDVAWYTVYHDTCISLADDREPMKMPVFLGWQWFDFRTGDHAMAAAPPGPVGTRIRDMPPIISSDSNRRLMPCSGPLTQPKAADYTLRRAE